MSKNVIVSLVAIVLFSGLILQQRSLRDVRSELANLKAAQSSVVVADTSTIERPEHDEMPGPTVDGRRIDQRLATVEAAVQQITRASELLMERGHLPLSEAKVAELRTRFLNASLPDAERLNALRVLHREKAVDDDVLRGGVEWLQTATAPAVIRGLLNGFEGLNSPSLREPLLRLASTHADVVVRGQAIRNLESFVDDAAVDALLWKALVSEQNADVQRQAEDSLRHGPMTEERVADLRQRTLNHNASFREQLAAFRYLSSAKVADAQLTAAFAESVVARGQADEMAALFRSLDNTGNLAAAPALVKGLQGGNPELRMMALDALSEMQSDATVVKWLGFMAENDADPRVRAEALRVLAQGAGR